MTDPIRILHLDDNPLDAELVRLALEVEQEKLPSVVNYVQTSEEYLAALERKEVDLILSDYRMGTYDGDQALTAARDRCPEIPFIMVTGELSEELVIETLKRGATDYVLKDRIFRLVPAIQRALVEAENKKKRLAAEHRLHESEERYRRVVDNIHDALLVDDVQGHVVYANERFLELFGVDRKDVARLQLEDYIAPEFREELRNRHERRMRGEDVPTRFEYQGLRADGTRLWLDVAVVPLFEGGRPVGTQSTIRDVTTRKQAGDRLRKAHQNLDDVLDSVQDPLYGLDSEWRLAYVNAKAEEAMGRSRDELLGKKLFDLYPSLRGTDTERHLRRVMNERISVRFETKSLSTGNTIEMFAAPKQDGGISLMYRDVSSRIRAVKALCESEERYAAIFERSPFAFALVKLPDIRVVAANEAALRLFEFSRDELVGMTSPEMGIVDETARDTLVQELLDRGTVRDFELTRKTRTGALQRLSFNVDRVTIGGEKFVLAAIQDVTERKAAEEALKQREAELVEAQRRMEGMLSSLTGGYYALDREWRFTAGNAATEEHFGRPLPELLGKNILELTGTSEDSPVYHKFQEARASGRPLHFETESHLKPGRWAEMHLYPRGELLEVFFADISARKQAEGTLRGVNQNLERQNRELEAERLKWQRLIEGIADEVWVSDAHGHVSVVNLATKQNLELMDFKGRSLAEALAEVDVFYPDGSVRPDEEAPLLRSLRGGVVRGEELVRNRRTGTSRIRQYSSAPVVDAEGNVIGSVAVIRDVTEEREAEAKIRRLNEELEERVEQRTAALERANKELESFSYSVSHDLKAPLRLIAGFAALLERQTESHLTTKQMEYLATIQEQTARMDELIRALLEFSRITRKEPALMPVDTRRLVEEVVHEQRQLLGDEAGRRIRVDVADLPVVQADAVLLRMVFTNLLSNAFKFTRTVNEPAISVEARRKDGSFQFRIKDNGVGFPKGQTEKLFKVFQRLHATGEFEGSGIGLANVRKIIERHGGQVCGEGEEGVGATFYFTLPATGSVNDDEG